MKLRTIICSFLLAICSIVYATDDLPIQMLGSHYVHDYAGLFTDSENNILERKLAQVEDSTTLQFAILTILTVPESTDIDTYATDIFTNWGIGSKKQDNGLLMLISKNDREVVMRTGYGTEAVLTDALCSQIIRKKIAPQFKEEKYYDGVSDAIDDVYGIVKGEFTPESLGYEEENNLAVWIVLFIIFILPAIILPPRLKRSYYHTLFNILFFVLLTGGRGGGGGGRGFGGGRTGGGGARGGW